MGVSSYFNVKGPVRPYGSYEEYSNELFALADYLISGYLTDMKSRLANEQGGYKNALYPDIETVADTVQKRLVSYSVAAAAPGISDEEEPQPEAVAPDDMFAGLFGSPAPSESAKPAEPGKDDLDSLFSGLGADETPQSDGKSSAAEPESAANGLPDDLMNLFNTDISSMFGGAAMDEDVAGTDESTAGEIFDYIEARIKASDREKLGLRFEVLSDKLELTRFSRFCLSLSLMACTQTAYAAVFQIINGNAGLSFPTIEAAARIYFGATFMPGGVCYGEMSRTIEQLQPIIYMSDNQESPFSSVLSADKRLIDYMFGSDPDRIDPQYQRFCASLAEPGELDPFLANKETLNGLLIAYKNGGRLFSLFGDEGSGRRFTVKHFCRENHFGAVSVDASKLFSYDYRFVERALWGIARECIFGDAVCCLSQLSYREEEKEKFFGYIDLAFGLLKGHTKAVFTLSEEKIPLREITSDDFTQLELPIPTINERDGLWEHYSKPYELAEDVDLLEMSSKFLFTAGKIKNSLKQGKTLSEIHMQDKVVRQYLFESCYNQMKHELTQKATKVKSTYTWDDIVMPADQRQTLEYVCDHMKYRKRVYEDWNYNRKYPYGRGLSVLLFGHPGTGKTMCAQVLANALNLELYRVDLSKVIDKYVGETEKSISMIFREAKKCNVVLFFDECDTLFGKRTDSGGSGEQSSNNKTAHLLQEVEAYDGVSVLATNFKHNIDPAFFRRMKFIVEFQFPDPETRFRIWQATIPKQTPLAEDVDLRFLADKFEFVGGNIKNCILNAAFLAAADGHGEEMGMKHLLLAIKLELVKTGKVFTRSDFEPYAHLIM